ncbi:hypothetical protein D3C76_1539120 [compost metagenome]
MKNVNATPAKKMYPLKNRLFVYWLIQPKRYTTESLLLVNPLRFLDNERILDDSPMIIIPKISMEVNGSVILTSLLLLLLLNPLINTPT